MTKIQYNIKVRGPFQSEYMSDMFEVRLQLGDRYVVLTSAIKQFETGDFTSYKYLLEKAKKDLVEAYNGKKIE